jgi:hypothetical protein
MLIAEQQRNQSDRQSRFWKKNTQILRVWAPSAHMGEIPKDFTRVYPQITFEKFSRKLSFSVLGHYGSPGIRPRMECLLYVEHK